MNERDERVDRIAQTVDEAENRGLYVREIELGRIELGILREPTYRLPGSSQTTIRIEAGDLLEAVKRLPDFRIPDDA